MSFSQRKESSAKGKPACLDTLQIEMQGSHSDISDNELTVLHMPPGIMNTSSMTTKKASISDGPRHISFDDSCKKESSESQRKMDFPQVSVIVEPPSPPVYTEEGRMQRISEIRRHSSHTASLTVKEFDKERERRHSGQNPNLLGLDSEHMKFLNCSPAASRRISCGSLFKVGCNDIYCPLDFSDQILLIPSRTKALTWVSPKAAAYWAHLPVTRTVKTRRKEVRIKMNRR